jgi:hypothetical protein
MDQKMKEKVLRQLSLQGKEKLENDQNITGDKSRIYGDARNISGDVSEIWGNVSGIRGDVSGIWGDVSEILKILRGETPEETKTSHVK